MDLNLVSQVLSAPASVSWAEVESWLKAQGMSLGFRPMADEAVSLGELLEGGHLVWGGALYGQPADNCVAVEARVGGQKVHTPVVPRSAAGPDFKYLVLGAGGQHARLTRVWMRVYPRPEVSLAATFRFPDIKVASGVAGQLLQRGVLPRVGLLTGAEWITLHLLLEGNRHLTPARMAITRRLVGAVGGIEAAYGEELVEGARRHMSECPPAYQVGWGQVEKVWHLVVEQGREPLLGHWVSYGALLYVDSGTLDPLVHEDLVEAGALPYVRAARLDRRLSRALGDLSEEQP